MTGHGGNIYRASEETGIPVRSIVDFSASVNPLGVPDSVAQVIRESIPLIAHYPEPFAESLADHVGAHLDVDARMVLCGNGSTELIYLVARALAPRRVLLPEPTFSEYERACRLTGASCVHHALSREKGFGIDVGGFIESLSGCDMAFLCNPNNPTGRLLGRDAVLAVANAARRIGCCLVVDEAFIEFAPGNSVAQEASRNTHLIVLRSLTKYYALPGLRIGYAVAPPALVARMKEQKEPWTINSLAQMAGIAALRDKQYQTRTLTVVDEEKTYLEQGMKSLKIDYVPSSANYYLIRIDSARKVVASLREKGILVRDCSNFIGLDGKYIRIAVRTREENAVLLKELARLCAA